METELWDTFYYCNHLNLNVAVNELSADSEKVSEKVKEINDIEPGTCGEATNDQKNEVLAQVRETEKIPDKITKKKEEVREKIKELKNGRKEGGKGNP